MLQHPDVLPHARQGHVECLGQIRDRRVASSEPLQDATPGGIGQRREGGIESAVGILNHLVQFAALSWARVDLAADAHALASFGPGNGLFGVRPASRAFARASLATGHALPDGRLVALVGGGR